ncbi:MAG: hypothetical protein M1834_002966 [Cirrosporium novae-zelandiae]|nr:MAG: hypothetical protein M1834_002966 [Cirrosporium novae-zelandiae]
MSPSRPNRTDREIRIKETLSFASNLQQSLSTNTANNPRTESGLRRQIENIPLGHFATETSVYTEIHTKGIELWNLCTKLKWQSDSIEEIRFFSIVCVFAFLLLDCAQRTHWEISQNFVRVFKAALKTTKACLEQKELDLSLKILERIAEYNDTLGKDEIYASSENAALYHQLSNEYLILRITLAWRQDRLEFAEHMYNKLISSDRELDSKAAEILSGLLCQMGKDLLEKEQIKIAIKWLGRAYGILSAQELEKLSNDARELRSRVMHYFVKALIGVKTEDSIRKAHDMLSIMENDFGTKPVVMVLELQLLAIEKEFDSQRYYDGSLIQDHADRPSYWAKFKNVPCKALDNFLCERLLSSKKQEWIEKVIVTRVWFVASIIEASDFPQLLFALFNNMASNSSSQLSPDATLAVQILLLKRIESTYNENRFPVAEQLCRLALHPLLSQSDNSYLAKIERTLILCCLGREDFGAAREAYEKMSEPRNKNPLTKHLMYKVAARTDDDKLATECLEAICAQSSEDTSLLYDCILEAERVEKKQQAATILQRILERYDYRPPEGVHPTALLHCIAKLLISELKPDDPSTDKAISNICKLFESAATQAKRARGFNSPNQQPSAFPISELDWFSQTGYNLITQHSTSWPLSQSLRLLESMLQFISLHTSDLDAEPLNSISTRRLHTLFISTGVLTTLAWSSPTTAEKFQHYLNLNKHVTAFPPILPPTLDALPPSSSDFVNLANQISPLLTFGFEALVHLHHYTSLPTLITLAPNICRPATAALKTLTEFAGIVLCAEDDIPAQDKVESLQQIVNCTWSLLQAESGLVSTNENKYEEKEQKDGSGSDEVGIAATVSNLAKWTRCLFDLYISISTPTTPTSTLANPSDTPDLNPDALALTLLTNTLTTARTLSLPPPSPSPSPKKTLPPYPPNELTYLSTTAFNHAVDLYVVGDDSGCRRWAEMALEFAGLVKGDCGVIGGGDGDGDGRGLERVLREKYKSLGV